MPLHFRWLFYNMLQAKTTAERLIPRKVHPILPAASPVDGVTLGVGLAVAAGVDAAGIEDMAGIVDAVDMAIADEDIAAIDDEAIIEEAMDAGDEDIAGAEPKTPP